jgi:phosphate transport system protein
VVIRELLRILSSEELGPEILCDLARMRDLACAQVVEASEYFWRRPCSAAERRGIYARDIEVNRLQRKIRKRMVALLFDATQLDHTDFLVLMCVGKDIERIGDYAKNLLEAAEFHCGPMPEDDIVRDLADTWKVIEQLMVSSARAFDTQDTAAACELNARGRAAIHRCDGLLERISRAQYGCALAVKLALGTRYYKRVCCHLVNILSSLIMPVHKLDYFDEKLLQTGRR